MGLFQRREGPDKVGLEGIGQPLADGAKLIKKETVFPKDTPSQAIFVFAPLISLSISLLLWSTIPFSSKGAFVNSEIMVIIFLAVSSMGSYGVIYAGWSSNNKYALMGSFRSVAQLISYEIIFSLIFMPAMVSAQSASFYQIVSFQKYHGCFI
jgi:NADH:ubiquinone oxidoreductase subunit H